MTAGHTDFMSDVQEVLQGSCFHDCWAYCFHECCSGSSATQLFTEGKKLKSKNAGNTLLLSGFNFDVRAVLDTLKLFVFRVAFERFQLRRMFVQFWTH